MKVTCSLTREDLGKFKYLMQCIKEALRMRPAVPFLQRVVQSDIEIDGKVLPAGATVNMAIYNLHHNPEIWPDHMVRVRVHTSLVPAIHFWVGYI